MHFKGRLLKQGVILINYTPFQNGDPSERKEFAPGGSKFFLLRVVPVILKKSYFLIG